MPTPMMQYHQIAAFVFLLFRVAKEANGDPFGSFEEQLRSIPAGMATPFKDFHALLTKIQNTVAPADDAGSDIRTKYIKLFGAAHVAIRDLMTELAADSLWSVCSTVEFDKLKDVVLLKQDVEDETFIMQQQIELMQQQLRLLQERARRQEGA